VSIARRVNTALIVQDKDGLHMPGHGEAQRWAQSDGAELTAITRGDHVDLYFGRSGQLLQTAVTTETAVAFARWLLRWYARKLWYGVKLRLWYWSLRQVMTEEQR
jgi:hypothetical protein